MTKMASRVYGVVQGQNLDVNYHISSVGRKTHSSNMPKKRAPSGQKPLGDLSNPVKPTVTQTSKKLHFDIPSIQEVPPFSKVTGPRKKKIATDAPQKKASVGGRKALADISNSGKPHLPETSRKILKVPTRLGSVSEEVALHNTEKDEHFLHDHQECIKVQTHSMDLDEFLKVVGLHNVVDQPASPRPSKPKAETPSGTSYLEEITEQLLIEEVKEDPSASRTPKALVQCKTPMRSGLFFSRTKYDSVEFCLMETPLSKKFC